MGRPMVESAGCDLNADEVRRWVLGRWHVPAQQTLGRVTATWQVADPPTHLVVTHPRAPGLLAVLLGQPPADGEPERYTVRLLTRRPYGGPGRWWFVCPRCSWRRGWAAAGVSASCTAASSPAPIFAPKPLAARGGDVHRTHPANRVPSWRSLAPLT